MTAATTSASRITIAIVSRTGRARPEAPGEGVPVPGTGSGPAEARGLGRSGAGPCGCCTGATVTATVSVGWSCVPFGGVGTSTVPAPGRAPKGVASWGTPATSRRTSRASFKPAARCSAARRAPASTRSGCVTRTADRHARLTSRGGEPGATPSRAAASATSAVVGTEVLRALIAPARPAAGRLRR